MFLDSFTQISSAQALTATAASEDFIDLQNPRDLTIGEDLALVINWRLGAGGTSPTFAAAIQVDDNTSFSSPTTLITSKTLSGTTAMPAGAQLVLIIPPFTELFNADPRQAEFRYLRANYTLGGTSPTMTIDATIVPARMLQNPRGYASGFFVS